jgi:uracil-DNA glycosylase
MAEISADQWGSFQERINICPDCLSQNVLQHPASSPGRPWQPKKTGRVLLISEAPPASGGFWQVDSGDDLRKNLQVLLKLPSTNSHQSCLENFMAQGFFLLQTIKWPIAPRSNGEGRNFNQLGPAQKRTLIDHSATVHLKAEIDLLSPSRILAMGNAAWQACQTLSPTTLKDRIGGVRLAHQYHLEFLMPHGLIPLHVTLLPLKQNLRFPEQKGLIQDDFENFLKKLKT